MAWGKGGKHPHSKSKQLTGQTAPETRPGRRRAPRTPAAVARPPSGRRYLIPQTAVVHGRQPVMDGGSTVLTEGLAGGHRVHVTVFQGLHHSLTDFLFNLFNF